MLDMLHERQVNMARKTSEDQTEVLTFQMKPPTEVENQRVAKLKIGNIVNDTGRTKLHYKKVIL